MSRSCPICNAEPDLKTKIESKLRSAMRSYVSLVKEFPPLTEGQFYNHRRRHMAFDTEPTQRALIGQTRELIDTLQPGLFNEEQQKRLKLYSNDSYDIKESYLDTLVVADFLVHEVMGFLNTVSQGTKPWFYAIEQLRRNNDSRAKMIQESAMLEAVNQRVGEDNQVQFTIEVEPEETE